MTPRTSCTSFFPVFGAIFPQSRKFFPFPPFPQFPPISPHFSYFPIFPQERCQDAYCQPCPDFLGLVVGLSDLLRVTPFFGGVPGGCKPSCPQNVCPTSALISPHFPNIFPPSSPISPHYSQFSPIPPILLQAITQYTHPLCPISTETHRSPPLWECFTIMFPLSFPKTTHLLFFVLTKMSWRSPLTSQYSR